MGAMGAHLIALKAEQKVGLTKHDTGPQILEPFSSLQLGMDHIGPEGKAFLGTGKIGLLSIHCL